MLKLHTLNKYYNRKKRNELHVLNDITIDFPSKGLVILLGPSGSGKTTLLNVLGGMDSFYKGSIEFEDEVIRKYSPRVWDDLRNEHIGMIFQNYYLLPHLSVYENIALTLRMVGIKDEQEIENRIYYLLKAVNMFNYRKRLTSQLSGGQQQRVAIARALAKNPRMILADEPTGNLDSKNTLDIMQIIKQISKTQLVVMVTHERDLAHYFADRIIELEDGKIIKNYDNESTGTLSANEETNIFLKDLHETTLDASDESSLIKLYQDVPLEKGFKARLVIKNKTLYIDLENSSDVKKVVVLDEKSELKLIDASLEDSEAKSEEASFDFNEVLNKELDKGKKRFNFNFKSVLIQSLYKILDASRGSKILYLGFAIGAMIVAFAVSNIFNIITVDDEDFLVQPRQTVSLTYDVEDYDAFKTLTTHDSIEAVNYYLSDNDPRVSMRLDLPSVYGYYQSYSSAFLSLSLVPNGLIDEGDIIHGRLANNPNEIVLDIALIRNLINNNEEIRALDIKNPESFLKMELFLEVGNLRVYPYQIVGVSDTKAPVAYADESFIVLASQSGMHPREFFNEDNLTILAGRDIQSDTELLISSAFQNPSSFTESSINLSGEVYTIVGVYEVREEGVAMPFTQFIATTELINTMHFDNRTNQFHKAYIYSNNPSETVEHFLAEDQEAIHIYSVERARYLANSIENSIGSLIFSAVSLVATAISFYFVMRSSMISRIYEIGVYRALGTRRFELIKRFIVESAVLTTFSSLIGFGFMTYMIYTTNQRSESFFEVGHVSFLSILSGVLFIYLVNILSGTLPVMMLLRKTPAQIATSYDI